MHLWCGDVFEEPSRELGGEELEVFADFWAKAAEAALLASSNIEHTVAALEKTGFGGRVLDDFTFGDWLDWSSFGIDGGAGGILAASEGGNGLLGGYGIRNWHSGFFAGRTMINFDPTLFEPEFDFFIATGFFGGHFEEIDFNFAATIKVADECVGEFRKSTGTDVAFNVIFVFVHDKKGVGLVEVFVELAIELGHAVGVSGVVGFKKATEGKTRGGWNFGHRVFVFKKWTWPVDYFVTAPFKVATPVEGSFVKFCAARNNQLFHS